MPLKLSFGTAPAVELDSTGDLAKHLLAEIDSLVNLAIPKLPDLRVADVPPDSASIGFDFSASPSWKINQAVGITLSVKPEAGCKISILKPGDTLCQYSTGSDSQQTPIKASEDRHYVAISLNCSIAVDAGVQYSAGATGVSGSVSASDQFRVAYYHRVLPTATLEDAVSRAFSNFVLPFHAESVQRMQDGDYLDFEFVGNLSLGFGVTYGFSGVLLAGRTSGEVQSSFATPIGKAVATAAPSFQIDAGFKLTYNHNDAFNVIVSRTANSDRNGATLYLLRKDAASISSTESFGLTLSAGAKFQADASTLTREIGKVTQKYLGATVTPLGAKLASAADKLADDVNSSVNQLLAKGDGQKIAQELVQSRATQDTALFIYNFDFTESGEQAYDHAMRGDYATAIMLPGVSLDTRSFIEQTYLASAGISLQLFGLLQFDDVTEYIQKNEIRYVGSRTFQIQSTEGVKEISGMFNKEQEADLYFLAACKSVAGSAAVPDVAVRLQAVLIDRNNGTAFLQTASALAAVAQADAAETVRRHAALTPHGTVRLTFDIPAGLFSQIQSDDYRNGHPPAEPHAHDAENYRQFINAFRAVHGTADSVSDTFVKSFGSYSDWLAFNRVKTDEQGSKNPGDRTSLGNTATSLWPDGYPPRADSATRTLLQVHIYAAQNFMNFCEGLRHLASAVPGVNSQQQYRDLLAALHGMVRHEIPFPTYFLKPAVVALMRLINAQLKLQHPVSDLPAASDLAITFDAVLAR